MDRDESTDAQSESALLAAGSADDFAGVESIRSLFRIYGALYGLAFLLAALGAWRVGPALTWLGYLFIVCCLLTAALLLTIYAIASLGLARSLFQTIFRRR